MTTAHEFFDAHDLIEVMSVFRSALSLHQATINRLNVFPVPDGDTGTNMLLTVESVMNEIDGLGENVTMSLVCGAIAQGSLMGARGNSGVILCQILRGLAKSAGESDRLFGVELAAGLKAGSVAAHQAVLRPAEGTILTVAKDAADAADALATSHSSLIELLAGTRSAAVKSLARTPELLEVLANAGVVDAGGAGLLCLFDALVSVASESELPTALALPDDVAERIADGAPLREGPIVEKCSDEVGELRYEVMYLLEVPDEAIEAFKVVWGGIGDSIVVVGGDGLYNCHIHTNDIGASIEAALDIGRPRDIRVTDLNEQVEEERWVRQGESRAESNGSLATGAPVTSVVSVGTGEGIRRVFRSLGVEHVIHGGQSMNPSTAEILEMIEQAPGSDVVVLPNNTNIYPVAAQAAQLSKKPVFVVATPGVQEAFAALLDYDPQASGEENAAAMTEAAAHVVCGEVTRAVRDTITPVGVVHVDDFIGLSRRGIESIAPSLSDATNVLLAKLLRSEHEIVTLIEGSSVPAGEVRRVTEWLADHHPGVALERIQGDQPLYPFFISIE